MGSTPRDEVWSHGIIHIQGHAFLPASRKAVARCDLDSVSLSVTERWVWKVLLLWVSEVETGITECRAGHRRACDSVPVI